MIIDEIKKANVDAIKSRDTVARAVLSVVINKYMLANIEKRSVGKDFTDEDMISILQKASKELAEEAENYKKINNMEEYNAILAQRAIVEKYLPAMMSAEDIKAIILSLEDRTLPSVMRHFKANFNGKCDMRVVSEVIKTL